MGLISRSAIPGRTPSLEPSAPPRAHLPEYYLVGQRDTVDRTQWQTEIGWPVFLTSSGDQYQPDSTTIR